jgi:hypothetical protein
MNSNESTSSDESRAFLSSLADYIEKTIHGTGFSRSGIVIEIIRNNKGNKTYALIHEGVPSRRYVLPHSEIKGLIVFLREGDSKV